MNQTGTSTYQQSVIGDVSMPGIVAIVDDDPQISNALGMWLELRGVHAMHHLSAESLFQTLYKQDGLLGIHLGTNNPVGLLLQGAVIDLDLPGMNGVDLTRILRQIAPTLPIAVITAMGDEERVHFGKLPPGVQCLKKPFDLDELEAALFPLPQ